MDVRSESLTFFVRPDKRSFSGEGKDKRKGKTRTAKRRSWLWVSCGARWKCYEMLACVHFALNLTVGVMQLSLIDIYNTCDMRYFASGHLILKVIDCHDQTGCPTLYFGVFATVGALHGGGMPWEGRFYRAVSPAQGANEEPGWSH